MLYCIIMDFAQEQYLLSLLVATILGTILGIQREIQYPQVGLRTHTLVCLGACLFSILSFLAPIDPDDDATRIAAGMVSGVGFLGASAILKHQGEIKGDSVAASIWGSAAIGLACGLQQYVLAVATTVLIMIAVSILSYVGKKMSRKKSTI